MPNAERKDGDRNDNRRHEPAEDACMNELTRAAQQRNHLARQRSVLLSVNLDVSVEVRDQHRVFVLSIHPNVRAPRSEH